ncbi:MAG: PIN domain-containing protein [Kofleriaceae bacterium]|nr:PIN domain-containing protein [Kofleriaceae bacterium]
MLAVDTNVLVYAHRREPSEHDQAFEIMRGLVEGSAPWAIPWQCVYEFFSVVTNIKIWKAAASTPEQASKQIAAWFVSPELRLLAEPDGFATTLAGFLGQPRVRGPIVHDARVAAICAAHGVERLLTRDRDFSLYPTLVTENPFA